MASWITFRPLIIVLRWQLSVTIATTLILIWLVDMPSALSAFFGGMVGVIPTTAFAIVVSRHKGFNAGGTIRTALRAEAIKIFLTITLLWIVFKTYDDVNALAFIGTFILTVIMHGLALFASDSNNKNHLN